MPLNHTDKATLAGLYLAKFNKRALSALGCTGFWQAFNIIGYSLEAGPASIKNYRDEFDHEISQVDPRHPRKGWQRPLKTRSQKIYAQFFNLGFEAFTELIEEFLLPTFKKETLIAQAIKPKTTLNLAQRLMTGQAAEAYFKATYLSIPDFADYAIEDVTSCGCGYDFHLSTGSGFFCVEVKGLGAATGTILLTDKEHDVAVKVKGRYCLFIVRDFQKTPRHAFFFDPLRCGLTFTPQSKTVLSYSTYIAENQ